MELRTRSSPTSKYEPFARHLSQLQTDEKTFSFAEVEGILGRPLPPSAAGDCAQQWWANTATHSQGKAWLDAGWRVDGLDCHAKRIRFRRQSGGEAISQPLSELSGLSPAALRMLSDYAEEAGLDENAAVVAILNETALQRRRQLLDWFRNNSPVTSSNSADLIREDRDSR